MQRCIHSELSADSRLVLQHLFAEKLLSKGRRGVGVAAGGGLFW